MFGVFLFVPVNVLCFCFSVWLLLKSWIYSSQFTRCILVPHSHTFQPNQIFCLPFCFYSFINHPFNLLQLPVTMVGSGVAGRQEGPGWCGQHFTFKVRFLNPAKDWKCWPHHKFCPSRGHVLSSCPSKLSCYPSEEDHLLPVFVPFSLHRQVLRDMETILVVVLLLLHTQAQWRMESCSRHSLSPLLAIPSTNASFTSPAELETGHGAGGPM